MKNSMRKAVAAIVLSAGVVTAAHAQLRVLVDANPSLQLVAQNSTGAFHGLGFAMGGAPVPVECDVSMRSAGADPSYPIYRQARESLNRGDYKQAAELFDRVAREYSKSSGAGFAADALYWQAFALYRLGTEDNLKKARSVLDKQRSRLEDQQRQCKAALDKQRLQFMESLKVQRQQQQEVLLGQNKQYGKNFEAQQEQLKHSQAALTQRQSELLKKLDEDNKRSIAQMRERSEKMLERYEAQSKREQENYEAQRQRNKNSKEVIAALEEQNRRSKQALEEQRKQSLKSLEEQMKQSKAAFESQRQQYLASFQQQQEQQRQSLANLDEQRRQAAARFAEQNKRGLDSFDQQREQRIAAFDERIKRQLKTIEAQNQEAESLKQRISGELAQRGDRSSAGAVAKSLKEPLNCDRESVVVRTEALTALSKLDSAAFRDTARPTLERHEDCFRPLRQRVVFLLGQQKDAEASRMLIKVVRAEPDPSVRRQAVLFVQSNGQVGELVQLYDVVEDQQTKRSLIEQYAKRDERAAMDKLIEIARKEKDQRLQLQAINVLGESKDPRAKRVLQDIAERK